MSQVVQRPPGPRGVPVLGSLNELRKAPTTFLLELANTYGPIAYARFGPTSVYIINDAALIEELLVGKHRDCIKDLGTRELVALVGTGLITSEGDFWRRQRKLAAPPLQPKRIAGYAQVMVDCAERMLAGFRDDEVRDIHLDMTQVTLEIVGRTLLGIDPRRDAEHIRHALERAMEYFDKQLRTIQGLLPLWVPTPDRIRFRKAMVELDRIVYRMIDHCRNHDADAEHLLARLLLARDDNDQPMTDKQLRDEAITMLLAGHETTALTLSYATYLLSENPPCAARLRAEIDSELSGKSARVEDLPKLRYLDAVVKETLRLYPPAYAMGREVVRDFELGGYTLPAGNQVMMSQYVMHRDARYFPQPERFVPERWLEPRSEPLPRFAYFPFGGGPRTCIGNHYAQMEAALVLATMTQQVELRVVPGYKLQLAPIVTLRPLRGLPVLVRRRKPAVRAAPDAAALSA